MDVHAHPHTPRKKWSHYFWEFLMLFLAVFCGFFAEYQLEHKIEKDRAKQYVLSFYEDLKTDTGRVSSHIEFDEQKVQGLANINNCFNTISKDLQQTTCLVTIIKHSALNLPFKMTTRTLNQLANAGGFRLLKKEDADSMIAYQKAFDDLQDFQTTSYQDAQDFVRSTFNQLASFNANAQMFRPKQGHLLTTFDEQDVTMPVLYSGDRTLLNKYFNELLLYHRVTHNHKIVLISLKNHQARLIKYFKNKYHLN